MNSISTGSTVPAFAISKYKVTNGEYLEFVRAGAKPPHFWLERDGKWFYRGMFAEIPLPENAPVFVTYAEAAAYARWAGKALPTEAQFHSAALEHQAVKSENIRGETPLRRLRTGISTSTHGTRSM